MLAELSTMIATWPLENGRGWRNAGRAKLAISKAKTHNCISSVGDDLNR